MTPPPPEPSAEDPDAALLRRCAAGDREALALLYERHADSVMAFVHHLTGDRALAEDVTQEAFVKAFRAAARFDPERARVRTWLFQIAKNHAWNELPRWRRGMGAGSVEDAEPLEAGVAAPEEASDPARREELTDALEAGLRGLSETLRATFVLVRVLGLSYAEAAEALEVPEGTVKSRMASAETYLRRRLRKFL
jgi:RNA polymerase sigma-70 factor (ECF subfamily)